MIKFVQMGGALYNIYQIVSILATEVCSEDEEYYSFDVSFSDGDMVTISQSEYEALMEFIKGLK